MTMTKDHAASCSCSADARGCGRIECQLGVVCTEVTVRNLNRLQHDKCRLGGSHDRPSRSQSDHSVAFKLDGIPGHAQALALPML